MFSSATISVKWGTSNNECVQTHCLLLGRRLLLRRRLFLRCGLLLGRLFLGGLLGLGTEFVGALDLDKNAVGNHLFQGGQEHGVHPLLVRGHARLHCLLDGNGGGAASLLEPRDGFDDSCFV